MDEDSDREDQPSVLIGGRITFVSYYTSGQEKKIIKINDGTKEHIAEVSGPIFVEVDDLITFKASDSRIGTNGAHKGKTIYLISDPQKIAIEMTDEDRTIERCFLRADYANGRKAYYEFDSLASEEGLTVADYLYQNCEELALGMTRDKYAAWWLKHRVHRRLWNLGLKRKDIEEYTETLQCKVAALYGILTTVPGPLHTTCVELGLAISLSKQFKIPYNDDDIYLARIARFIYHCSAELKHVCVGKKTVRREFSDIHEWKEALLARYPIVIVGRYYFLGYNYKVQEELVTKLGKLITTAAPPVDVTFTGSDTADRTQRKAVTGALNNRLFGIFGPAGSGKTTIIKYVVRNLEQRGVKYILAGPTGPSVSHLSDSIQPILAPLKIKPQDRTMTLHMLLKRKGRFLVEHLIIDEVSMVNHALLYEILKAYPSIKFITVVGDNNQLQPLKWGNLMEQLLLSEVVPCVKLRRNYRAKNPIFQFDENDNLISTPYCQLKSGKVDEVVVYYKKLLDQGISHRDIITITPTNAIVDELNTKIQEVLTEKTPDAGYLVDKRGRKFIVGDKVILLKNNYEIEQMNGDIGVVIGMDKRRRTILVEFIGKAEEYKLSTSLYGGDYSFHGEGEMMTTDSLSLAHAVTTHKSQGAQWPIVIFVFPGDGASGPNADEFYNFNMIYTGLSRTIMRVRVIGNIGEFRRSFGRKAEAKIDHLGKHLAAFVLNPPPALPLPGEEDEPPEDTLVERRPTTTSGSSLKSLQQLFSRSH